MKRTIAMLLSFALLAVACQKDDITVVTDTTSGATNGSGDNGSDTTTTVTTDYDRTVTIVYSTSGAATVRGAEGAVSATVSGNDVTIRNAGDEKVLYVLSGSTSDGFLKIYSGRKQGLQLNSVNISNSRGAAINVQGLEETPNKGKRVDVFLSGSSTLADGATYSLTPSTEDEKAAFFSEGQIVFSGNGTLTVNARGKAGVTSDDWVQFLSGATVNVSSSAGHGVRGKDYILVSGGTIDVSVSANGKKGFSSDSLIRFDAGETTIRLTGNTVVENGDTNRSNCIKADQVFEMNAGVLTVSNSGTGGKGISGDGVGYFRGGEVNVTVTGNNFGSSSGGGHGPWGGQSSNNSVGAKGIKFDGDIEISGGVITVMASKHEGIETKGTLTITGGEVYSQSSDDAINSASHMTITGGYVCAYSTGNDGLDANGNMYIKGGVVYAIGKASPEMAIDANTEGGYKLYVQGGIIFAIGSLENGAQLSQSCWQASSWSKNVWYSMKVGDETYLFKTPSSGGTKLVVSAASQPEVTSNVTTSSCGTEMLNGMVVTGATATGGNSVNLTTYSSGGGWGW
ncbi:MAG: carbohydrate-binding domain-containing protein [Bacteroidales bacterium]|nr:carbohydrate-binding domain-containing protein [Bacteroidales bacterium]